MGSIEKIHKMLVSKECSCTELTKSYLDEIEKADGELNAYVNVTGEEALKTAEAVDRKIASGEEIGMLEGVPMTLKDNISTKGNKKGKIPFFMRPVNFGIYTLLTTICAMVGCIDIPKMGNKSLP